jgi:DNA-binding transcriptional ArsR family regulator
MPMPADPAGLNAVGDLVLSGPLELRALADPLRLTLFDLVRRQGPATSTALAQHTDEDPATIEDHLRVLESVGLVEEAGTDGDAVRWRAAVKGIYFEIPEDSEGQRAARDLSNVMLSEYAALPAAWVAEEEPKLELEWARAAGLFNARVDLTADELRAIQDELEQLLAPFTTRASEEMPAGAAPVRILVYLLPEAKRDTPAGE